jgi:putative ABC transport system permease protein
LFDAMRVVKPAFPADRVVAMRIPARDLQAVAARVAAIPGVERVAIASGVGRGGGSAARAETDDGRSVAVSRVPVGAGFFETLGVPMVRGRSFDAGEIGGRADEAVLSESAARAVSPSGEAIGMHIRLSGSASAPVLVVGVCRDAIDYGSLARVGLIPPDVYVPFETTTTGEALVLARVPTDGHMFLRAIAAAAESPDGARRPRAGVMADGAQFGEPGAGMVVVRLFGGFSVVALLLAASGVFGVISQSVAQRTREFGIRMALGATPRGVLRFVLARETKLIAAAIGSGVAVTFGLTRALFAELAALGATAPSIWITVIGLGGGVAGIACLLATWRIVRLDPAGVLRRT